MTAATTKPRSRYWGLALRGLAWSLVLLAAVTLGTWFFVDSQWLRERARRTAVAQASERLERQVGIGRLDFDLWPPRVTLGDVSIAGAAPDTTPLLVAEEVSIGFGPGLVRALRGRGVVDLRSIDVVAPHIHVVVAEDGTTNLPPILERLGQDDERGESALKVRLGALHVVRGRLDLAEHAVPLDFEAEGIRAVLARLAGSDEAFRLALESRRVTARLPGPSADGASATERPALEARLEVEADFAGGAVEIARLDLAGEWVDLEASGLYRERRLEAKASGRLDLAALDVLGEVARMGAGRDRPVGVVSFDGRVTYDEGAWSTTSDVATAPLTAGTRRLPPLVATVEASGRGGEIESLSGTASGRSIDVSYSGSYTGGRLALALEGWADGVLAADLDLTDAVSGRVAFDADLEIGEGEWQLTADVASEEVRYETYVLTQASARLGATPEAVRAEAITASAVGGSIGGTVIVDLVAPSRSERPRSGPLPAAEALPPPAASLASSFPADAFPVVTLDLTAQKLDVKRFVDMSELAVQGLAGRVSGEFLYAFEASEPRAGRGRGVLAFERLDVVAPTIEGRRPIQLTGRVPVAIDGGTFRVTAADLSARGQTLVVSGGLALEPESGPGPRVEAEFDLMTEDPRAVLRLLPALYETDPEPIWEPLRGRGTVHGRLLSDPDGFAVTLDLELAEAAVAATEADRMSGTLTVDSGGVQSVDLELLRGMGEAPGEPSPAEGRLHVTASIPFSDTPPGFAVPPFVVRLSTVGWPLADAAPWLPFELPAAGLADVELELGGDLEAMSGSLSGTVVDPVLAGVPFVGRLTGAAAFTPEELTIDRAVLDLDAGRLELAGRYGLISEALDLALTAERLDVGRSPFSTWIEAPVGGFVTVGAEIGGTLVEPRVVAELVGSELALGEIALGRDGESRLDVTWENGQLVARGSLLGLLRVDGGGRLDQSRADVTLAVSSHRVGALVGLAVGAQAEEITGELAGTLRLFGAVEALEARLTLEQLRLEQGTHILESLEPVVVTWRESALRLESLFMGEERSGTELFVAGDLVDPQGGLDLVVQSSVDARWLAPYLPGVTLTGQINALGVVRGSLTEPALDGQADLVGARMIVSGFPHAVDRLSGLLFFYPERIVIDSGTARLAGGRLRADGVLEADESGLWGVELRLRGDDLDLRYPEDWRFQGDAELTLAGSAVEREITGVVTLERAEYQRDFKLGLMTLLRTIFERRTETVREIDELLVDTKLNILVDGPEALFIETNLADIQGSLDFSVRGSLAEPVLLGDVRLLRGGKIDIGGAEYVVERGTLNFSNPFRNAPRLDLVAKAQVREYDVRLNIYGPLEKLETTFSSNPPLADVDIVSLLATGSTETLSSFGSTLVTDPTASAESFLAGQAASLAGERVGTLIGLDQVQISPLTGGTADLSTARFTVGKRLGSDLFVTYSYDPSRSREEIYELTWQISSSLALILTRSDEGSFALDLEWNTTF